nr:acyltransferase [uncultured Acetatifactor sp.]
MIKEILKNVYWRAIYGFRYVILYRKFGKVGLHTVIKRPLRIVRGGNTEIGDRCFIMDGLRCEAVSKYNDKSYHPEIKISDNVSIQQGCHITCANKVLIGSGTAILPYVLITDIEHMHIPGLSPRKTDLQVGEVIIGENVSIGMGARIIGKQPIKIGDNAVIGANAVVVKSVEEGAIVGGIPAKVIGWNKKIT